MIFNKMILAGQDLCQRIDPELQFVEAFKPWVYKVEKAGQVYVLKRGIGSSSQLISERDILKTARNIPGITHLVHDYGLVRDNDYGDKDGTGSDKDDTGSDKDDNNSDEKIYCILKEYAPGKTLNFFSFKQDGHRITDTGARPAPLIQSSLYDTVQQLHSLRIANLWIHSEDMVVNPEQTAATIIDLDMAFQYSGEKDADFLNAKETDLWIIGRLLY